MNRQLLRNIILVGLFLIPFIPFLVSSSFFFPFITTKAFTWRVIVEVIFAAWLLLAMFDVDVRPKKSLILYAILSFLGVIGLADLLGVAPFESFWSNFERMEGFITLIHLGMFFVVIASIFKEIDWKRWWNVSLGASFLMVIYCFLQIIGLKTINQGGVRVDGTLGNAIYLAVYMLFHIFIAMLFMWREWKNTTLRWVYGVLIFLQVLILYYTATRGAILGLLGGLFIMAILNLRNKEDRLVRKASVISLVGLVMLVGGFLMLKDRAFIQNSPVLSRFASLNTSELKTQGRYFVWPMALQGVKEHPILGWGQENFNYVFQEHYTPDMFRLEPWFDRAHNIFLDWAVAGGILGLISYLSLYAALIYLIWKGNEQFSYTEKSILTGLIAAYFFHNFFVFDHLISYILFFSLLSYIHYIKGINISWENVMTQTQVRNFALPIVVILLGTSLYFVNIKPIMANVYLIDALKALQTPGEMNNAIQYFEKSYKASSFGQSEVTEHISANAVTILTSDLPMEARNNFFSFAKDAIIGQVEKSSNNARYQLIAGSFLSSVGLLDEALTHLERAEELMPNKQQTYFEIGAIYINKKENDKALEVFKKAYDMAPEYLEAKLIYLIGAIYANNRAVESEVLKTLTEREVIFDDRVLNAYYANGRTAEVINLLQERIKLDPANEATYRQYLKKVTNPS